MSFVLKIALWLFAISALRHWWRQAFAAPVAPPAQGPIPGRDNDAIEASYRVLKREGKDNK